jgi:hypothetical protein
MYRSAASVGTARIAHKASRAKLSKSQKARWKERKRQQLASSKWHFRRGCALPDLYLRIGSARLAAARLLNWSPLSPGAPGLSLTQPRGVFGGSLWASSGHSLWTTSRISSEIAPMWSLWNVGRRECTGQLPHSWRSASDSKSTAICRPSSDQDASR